ncbi:hypothetical protein [Azohydromonas lata]|uniref:hypothetical protein n=1 Tax=Azohydromonas lata TaxID=45677 RepID=UPI00082EC653|nr:hypothetical protein [Azohydromonas lata]
MNDRVVSMLVASLLCVAAPSHAQSPVPTDDTGRPAMSQAEALQMQQQLIRSQQSLVEASKALHRVCMQQQEAMRRQGVEPAQRCIPPVEPAPLFQTGPSERSPQ